MESVEYCTTLSERSDYLVWKSWTIIGKFKSKVKWKRDFDDLEIFEVFFRYDIKNAAKIEEERRVQAEIDEENSCKK